MEMHLDLADKVEVVPEEVPLVKNFEHFDILDEGDIVPRDLNSNLPLVLSMGIVVLLGCMLFAYVCKRMLRSKRVVHDAGTIVPTHTENTTANEVTV